MHGETTREVTTLRRLHDLMTRVNSRHDLHEVLQMVAEGVAEVAGFRVAAIRYLHPDGTLEMLALAGDDAARAQLIGTRKPVEEILAEFEYAEAWGILRFVPHERLPGGSGEAWIPDLTPIDGPDAWHPEDTLYAPLYGPTGDLVGMMGVDLPYDGRRPTRLQREVLEMYAVQAGIAITNAKQRLRLAEQVRLGQAQRTITQTAGRGLALDAVIDDSVEPVVTGLRCRGMWIRAFEGEGERPGRGRGAIYPPDTTLVPPDELVGLGRRMAPVCWERQVALIVSKDNISPAGVMTVDEASLMLDFVATIAARTVLLAPMGAGPECLGYLALTRTAEQPEWSEDEVATALEIGRDLGRAVLHARLYERETQLVEELQQLDRYKTELIATISHELKNPLTSILGYLEILDSADHGPEVTRPVAALVRNTERLRRLVEDLLLLSKVGDPNRPLIPAPVDLAALVGEAAEMLQIQAGRLGITLDVSGLPGAPANAWGERAELDRMVTNILSNAIKYSPNGGTVRLAVDGLPDQVVFCASDEGLGISEHDQEHLFTEFYRSSNPDAAAIPGTGLGLAIVERIVQRHGGTISVESRLGEGSTFRVVLPAAPAGVLG